MSRFLSPRVSALFIPASLALLLSACGTEQVAVEKPVTEPATPTIRDGSLMEPGRPQLAVMPQRALPGMQPVTWNMWWGENGRHWAVYVNGKQVQSGELTAETPKAQQATVELPMDKPGSYEIDVALCNDHGCSESEPVVMNVAAG